MPVTETTGGTLKCFVGVNVKVSGLEGPACLSLVMMKKIGCPLDCFCCPMVVTWLCSAGWITWLAGI